MKSLSTSLQAEKAKGAVTYFHLIECSTYHWTDAPEPLVISGTTYEPYPMEIDSIVNSDANTLDGMTIKVGNADLTIGAVILNDELRDKTVTLSRAWYDSGLNLVDTEIEFKGKVDGRPGVDENWATITVAPHRNPWARTFPSRRISKACSWIFKSTDCGYAGATTSCDKSYTACTNLTNSSRFGGFRFTPSVGSVISANNTKTIIRPRGRD